jgi:hypothetical protein
VALGQQGGENEKTLLAKVLGGSQKLSGNSSSSLAVFYVEQVALNRHVCRNSGYPFMLENQGDVKRKPFVKNSDNILALWRVKWYVT